MIELDNTEEKIVRATFEILQKEGFTKATTKKIASKAGVNEVTVFRKFDNKKKLIEITKKYYLQILITKLEEIFNYREDEEIEEFLKISFYGILNLSDNDFSVIKVSMEEVREKDDKKLLISQITDVILNKMEEFFKLQIEKGRIRDLDAKSLSVMCFSVLFQSVILWKIYNKDMNFESNHYADDILDMLFNGIRP